MKYPTDARFGSIDDWGRATGMARRTTYHQIAAGNLKSHKSAACSLLTCNTALLGWRLVLPLRSAHRRRAARQRRQIRPPNHTTTIALH
jgi:hypothetical protein